MEDPRPVVGVVGAGQLARMCWQAAIGLDIELRVLAAGPDDAAAAVLPGAHIGEPDDPGALRDLAEGCDVLTVDHELVDLATLRALEADGCPVRPSADALQFAKDKAFQRTSFRDAGLPVPDFVVADGPAAARDFAATHGWPIVCKRPRGGYDGRGVWRVADAAALDAVWAQTATDGTLLVERDVPIERELAVLIARRPGGAIATAPLIETVQRDHMLHELVVPAPVPAGVARDACELGAAIVDRIGVVGICAIELFWTQTDLLVNEVATRPHNSGHWTIDGASTSQFENHLRAVLDLPLGSMRTTSPAVCSVNVVGGTDGRHPHRGLSHALALPDVHVHLYGKAVRPGRKLGHVTATADDRGTARRVAGLAADALMGAAGGRPAPHTPVMVDGA